MTEMTVTDTHPETRWPLVAEAIEARIKHLGMYKTAVAAKAAVSNKWLSDVTSGTRGNFEPPLLARLSEALGWPPDMIERIIEGNDPPPPEWDYDQDRLDRIEVQVAELTRLVGDLVEGKGRRRGRR